MSLSQYACVCVNQRNNRKLVIRYIYIYDVPYCLLLLSGDTKMSTILEGNKVWKHHQMLKNEEQCPLTTVAKKFATASPNFNL